MNAFKMTAAGLAMSAHAMEKYSMVYMWSNDYGNDTNN
jgi:hypothetical protein